MSNGNGVSSGSYCIPGERNFRRAYVKVHGYLAVLICLFGCAANSVNIAVLSRKEMRSSTNTLLTALAVADLLVMLEYIPYALHSYVKIGKQFNSDSYGWAVFIHFHSIFSLMFHTISIWLTISLALLRYIAIKFPLKNKTLCKKRNINVAIALSCAISAVLCLPMYFTVYIREEYPNKEKNDVNMNMTMTYQINASEAHEPKYFLDLTQNEEFLTATSWIYSVIFKIVPCILLSICVCVCLISIMKSSDRKRQKLFNNSAITTNEARLNEDDGDRRSGSRTDRTTRMLVGLLGLFLVTELPPALFNLLIDLAPRLFENCFYALSEAMDMMALIGSSVNFVLYCSMSKQFRNTFIRLARKALLQNRMQVAEPPPTDAAFEHCSATTTVAYL